MARNRAKIVYRENHLYKNNKSNIDDREVGFFPYSRVEITNKTATELVSANGEDWIILTEKQVK